MCLQSHNLFKPILEQAADHGVPFAPRFAFWLLLACRQHSESEQETDAVKTKGPKRKDWVLSRSAPDPTHCLVVSALAHELFRAGVTVGPHLLGTTHS